MIITLHSDIQKHFSDTDIFNAILAIKGEIYRHEKNRCTQRINLGGQYYFIKKHMGVGWKEIFKNIFQLRWPVLGAKNEYQATHLCHKINVAVAECVGYGLKGYNPATLRSFLITRALAPTISLEDLCRPWLHTKPNFAFKKMLITEVATIARKCHAAGLNHRDFYLCHFLWDISQKKLYLIDLHRAQIRRHVPKRWLIKDLAGLYFSSRDIGLTRGDYYRFIQVYTQKSLRCLLGNSLSFWKQVKNRGDALYQAHI